MASGGFRFGDVSFTKGAGVKELQEALTTVYYYLDKGTKNNGIDGYYGPVTKAALQNTL
ncbi:N-acetylmuramoyl-L-alanine amidase CwlA [Bacillus safensis subsp. safensis]|uniref:peptidoglycan-binding domain-containing protein n=1 Tax=Bacillus safensis TaxID=561879 RepID=UPI00399C6E66